MFDIYPFLIQIKCYKWIYYTREITMKRTAELDLINWIKNKRRKPLIIRGARQVGKSTLVRQFAENSGLRLLEINLEKHLELDKVFATLNVKEICRELEGFFEQKTKTDNSLLFLDEIQSTPHALQSLRYFYEDFPELPVIATGSLLEFTLSKHNFPMPVGRIEYFHLGPMSFEEFMLEINPNLLEFIKDFDFKNPIPKTVHKKLLNHQREYLLIGGLPEAVQAFSESENSILNRDVQQSIISTYQDDFSKYASQKALIRLHKIFRSVPKNVGKKIKYSHIVKDENAREVRYAIDLLSKARVITHVHHSHCTGIPLSAESDNNVYKLLFLDIGLMNRLLGNDWLSLNSMEERELVNEGPIAEQFIGQHLFFKGNIRETPSLHYWLRKKKSTNAEVDYVISKGNLIIPIEVKSGKSGTMKSMLQFIHSRKSPLGVRFDLNPPSAQKVIHHLKQSTTVEKVAYTLISLPLYLVDQLDKIVDDFRQGKIIAK
jgi:uncharacterized protein